MFQDIKSSLQQLYREDEGPWLLGFSGDVGPSSARPGPKALRPYNDAVLSIPAEPIRRLVCPAMSAELVAPSTVYRMPFTVFPIPAIAERIEGTLRRCRNCSEQHNLNTDAKYVASTGT
jgi:hypothetical protein